MRFLDVLATDHLIGHHVFPSLEQHSKPSDHKGRNADEDHVEQEEQGIFDYSEDGLVLLAVEHAVGSSLHEEVEEVGEVEAEGCVVEKVAHVVL